MFRGTFQHLIDEKGRVAIPSRFREQLLALNDHRIVITNFQIHGHPCLDVYPYSSWLKLEEQLRAKPQFDPRILHFVNFYVASAHDLEIDRNGRVLLPPTLREFARLKREVVFTSAIDKFRIWDVHEWRQVFEAAAAELTKDPAILEHLGV